jgi:LPPG:FO 2-phospho-L-lactate transferase
MKPLMIAPDIVVLAGGVGAARFLEGLAQVIDASRLTVIGNVGDDLEQHGLHISPDLDTVTYTLAGIADPARGWGIAGDTFECLQALRRQGVEAWFQLGDRDLATHLLRTQLLREGVPLCDVTRRIAGALGVRARLLPATEQRLRTRVRTEQGMLDFQTYFVAQRTKPEVLEIVFDGAETAQPAPGVVEAIARARGVIVAPSNPLISIGPILAVAGIRSALVEAAAQVAAISPIVGGRALKGPADRMLRSLGHEVSALGVARMYRDFLDVMILDDADRHLAPALAAEGLRPVVTDTIMSTAGRQAALARTALEALGL